MLFLYNKNINCDHYVNNLNVILLYFLGKQCVNLIHFRLANIDSMELHIQLSVVQESYMLAPGGLGLSF